MKKLKNFANRLLVKKEIDIESLMHIGGKNLSALNKTMNEIQSVDAVEFKVSSQWGEDGIIDWLVENAKNIPETFVEFGVEDYREANTRFLMMNKNWSGLVIDGSKENIRSICESSWFWKYRLSAKHKFVSCENINDIIFGAGFVGEIGLLSIDIDGNDYWVWDSLTVVNPVFVVCEYNAMFGDLQEITIPYDPEFQRTRAHYSNIYFGASISALCTLANKKGYQLLGTNKAGCNAFFVRDDFFEYFKNRIKEIKLHPAKFRETRNAHGRLSYQSRDEAIELIHSMPVHDVQRDRIVKIEEIGEMFSNA